MEPVGTGYLLEAMQMLLDLDLEADAPAWDCEHVEWRSIEWAPGYEVSSLGGFRHRLRGTLNGTQANNGYRHVGFIVDGKQLIRLAHRVVAGVFLPNPRRRLVVNHKSGEWFDNRVANLEWASRSHNSKDAWARKRGVA